MQVPLLELERVVPIFRTDTCRIDAVYFNSGESLLFSTTGTISAVLKDQIRALQEDIRVCQSQLTFKGNVYNYRSRFVWEYKGKQLIKRKAFKNGETDIPFQVQFSPATVFATYHSNECLALKRLGGVSAEDLNQDFNEPLHFCAAVTGVDLLMPRLCGIKTGPTQSIKWYKLFAQNRFQNYALCSVVFPLSLSWYQLLVDESTKTSCPRKCMHLFHFHTTVMNLFTWIVYILHKCMCVWAKERVCERRWNPTVFCPLSEPFILAHVLRHPFHLSKAWCVAHMANKRVPNTCQ